MPKTIFKESNAKVSHFSNDMLTDHEVSLEALGFFVRQSARCVLNEQEGKGDTASYSGLDHLTANLERAGYAVCVVADDGALSCTLTEEKQPKWKRTFAAQDLVAKGAA